MNSLKKYVQLVVAFWGLGWLGGRWDGQRDEQKSGFFIIVLIFYTMKSESLLRNNASIEKPNVEIY